jgi:hypothetical protein
MGNASARHLAAVVAALLSTAGAAQEPTPESIANAPAQLQLLYCGAKNLQTFAASKDDAISVATAALALCERERERFMAENRGSIVQWQYHRQIAIDRLVASLVQWRMRNSKPQ